MSSGGRRRYRADLAQLLAEDLARRPKPPSWRPTRCCVTGSRPTWRRASPRVSAHYLMCRSGYDLMCRSVSAS